MKTIGLYIHVPFCSGKCPYCDFFSVKADEKKLGEYTDLMEKTLASYAGRYAADTVYFGGGTPGLLGTGRLERLLVQSRRSFGRADEVTIEVNPESVPGLDFEKLAHSGVNRVSIGLQSANDDELKILGRRHTAADALSAVETIRSAGIENISLDLMIGVPGQTADSLTQSIDFCANAGVKHISSYILKIEERTLFYRRRDSLDLPDEDTVCDMYEASVARLAKHGFRQYEISNFCKEGFESRHNLKYWHCEEYLGLGPSAHSFLDGRRSYCGRSFGDFADGRTVDDGEGGGREEYIALALRLSEGLIYSRYQSRFNEEFPRRFIKNAEKFIPTGMVNVTDEGISFTPKGFLCSNTLTANILYDT